MPRRQSRSQSWASTGPASSRKPISRVSFFMVGYACPVSGVGPVNYHAGISGSSARGAADDGVEVARKVLAVAQAQRWRPAGVDAAGAHGVEEVAHVQPRPHVAGGQEFTA